MENKKKIKVFPNGPYEVTGNVPLNKMRYVLDSKGYAVKYEKIQTYPAQETYHLCRCGKSKNKPFCDGSHLQGFDGTETASHQTYDEMATLIKGKFIDMLDAEKYCVIARFCDTHGSAWKLVTNSTMPESEKIVIQQCSDCPSGRLTAVMKDGKRIEPELPQEISILEDPEVRNHGPIWVKGGIVIEDEHGKAYPVRNRVTLCRCGMSQNKPFCDARHMKIKNED